MQRHEHRRIEMWTRTMFAGLGAAVTILLLGNGLGCQARRSTPPAVRILDCPAPPGSAEPNLARGHDRLYLSWLVAQEPGHRFEYATLQDGQWSTPHTIAAGDSFFANWADFPSLVELSDGSLCAHWLQKSGADPYAYDVLLSRTADGMPWPPGFRPHRDGTPTEHGFLSLAPDARGGATLVWLDGRDYATRAHDAGETHLMAAGLTADGCTAEQLLDARVCDCCQTAAVSTSRGILVAYRDRAADEVRDISLVRFENGAWSAPYALAVDGWMLAGCPVNGPALAADGERVAAARFTMANQVAAVHVSLSRDGGLTFPVHARVDDGDPHGRVDIVLLPHGGALVLWVEAAPDGAAMIRARRVRDDGSLDPSFPVAPTSAERASGFPRLECLGDTVYFAWTEPGEPAQVRMASLELPSTWREE